MTFEELLKQISSSKGSPAICVDSRLVKAGDIFVAIKGTACDGNDFINEACTAGAKFIVTDRPCQAGNTEIILTDDSAKAAGLLAQASRGNPASRLTNLAVTGTNGKTTTAFLVRACIQKAGKKCGLISTVIYDTGAEACPAGLTTPDCLTIADKQKQMVEAGSKYMMIEASSHALSQDRLVGINFKAAAFTNLTGDHLDYHKTEADYLNAKTRLFEKLSPQAVAVLNKASPAASQIARRTAANILWYSIGASADINAHIESMDITGTVFDLEYAGQRQKVKTPLLGRYNVSNHLAAAGLCLSAGLDLNTIAAGLSALPVIPGRLEKVDWNGNFSVLIDYAHTDDALKNVLTTLRPMCKGNLTVVFGCGGDRDTTKRPRMAMVTEQLADFIVVTTDNPRTEQPEYIIGEILAGFDTPTAETIKVEIDRKKAIELAIKNAGRNDIVLIAGKGHEDYQIIGKRKFEFSDKEVALQCLKRLK